MKPRLRDLLLLLVTAAPLIAGILWLSLRRPVVEAPAPTLWTIRELAGARKFDQAYTSLETYLASHPTDESGLYLMAKIALDLAKPQPELALVCLSKLHAETPERAALIQFFMGKAHYLQARYDLAESCWREAIRLYPKVPEAGLALFDLLSLEGRQREAHDLGLQLHQRESDPRDRVQLLIELIHLDIDKSAPGSIVLLFKELAEKAPDNSTIASTYGLALVHASQAKDGLEILRAAHNRYPNSVDVWNAWLTGLEDAGQSQEHAAEFARLPQKFKSDPRFLKHEGFEAQGRLDWQRASDAYRRAVVIAPYDGVLLYRFSRALRLAGHSDESDQIDARLKEFQTAYQQIRPVVAEVESLARLGYEPQTELYQRVATLRERMGRPDDALAWHRLVIRDRPDDPISLAAISRLTTKQPSSSETSLKTN